MLKFGIFMHIAHYHNKIKFLPQVWIPERIKKLKVNVVVGCTYGVCNTGKNKILVHNN